MTERTLCGAQPMHAARLCSTAPDAGLRRRLGMCLQAQRLYSAIESLANYIEAEALGDRADRVREENETLHRVALRSYLRKYGGGWSAHGDRM